MKRASPKNKYRRQLVWLTIGGLIATFTPLLIVIGINFDRYFETTASALGITFGGFMVIGILILQMLGKLKRLLGSAFVATGVMFLLSVCFMYVLQDLTLLLGMAFIGEALYSVFFKYPIERTRKQRDYCEQANVVKQVMEDKGNG